MNRYIHYTKKNTLRENEYREFSGRHLTLNCKFCNDTFKAKNPTALYCSQRCQNDVFIEKRSETAKLKRKNAVNCVVCLISIKQTETKKIIKYCSPKCKQKQYRLTKKVTI